MPVIARHIARLRAEHGFTMVTFAGAMLVTMTLVAATFAAVDADQGQGRRDQDTKLSYAAAEAGLADYQYHLNQDNAYWAKCTNVSNPNAVNQPWNGAGADTRTHVRQVPGTTNAFYAIELLPTNGFNQCVPGQAQQSMIDPSTGMFRIRVTGWIGNATNIRRNKRSIIATFRRKGFLDFLYFTDFETSDPTWYVLRTRGYLTDHDFIAWASSNCARYYRNGRPNQEYDWGPPGSGADNTGNNRGINGYDIFDQEPDSGWHRMTGSCTEIQFANTDVVAGPLHTNDEILVCGSPDFGRNAQDRIEVSSPPQGWRPSCSGSNPTFNGTWIPSAPILSLPPSDNSLRNVAEPSYRFTGRTTIVLNGGTMTVTAPTMGIANQTMALPSNGVVYVQNGSCGVGYRGLDPYNSPTGCADVFVRGSYSQDLTIASEKDIVVNGNITRSGDVLLGLISNEFVRVYHPGDHDDEDDPTECDNDSGTMNNVTIDAAILALQHSFTVDNYYCGSPLGTLSVNGVIAQKFRGPVGMSSGSTRIHGYSKDYEYDDRLRYRSPPHFLDPVQSSWRLVRQTEQLPPR
jgi:Tfp pilus assembly protein PilX